MKYHIEYDNFGEYPEVLEETDTWETDHMITASPAVGKTMINILRIVTVMTVMLGTAYRNAWR